MSLNIPELSQHASLKPQHPSEYTPGQYGRPEAASIIKLTTVDAKPSLSLLAKYTQAVYPLSASATVEMTRYNPPSIQ